MLRIGVLQPKNGGRRPPMPLSAGEREKMRLAAPLSFGQKAVGTSPVTMKRQNWNDFFLALDCLHRHRRVLPDLAQCHAARADDEPWHRWRHPCAVPVRLS